MADFKLDIFETLKAIDTRNFEYFDKLSPEARKGFAPIVVLRWVSSTYGRDHENMLLLVNYCVNQNFFDLYDHPELQYKLLASCGLGAQLKHQWINMPKRKHKTSKVHDFLQECYPQANGDELHIIFKSFDKKSFKEFLNENALEDARIKELVTDYDRLIKKTA